MALILIGLAASGVAAARAATPGIDIDVLKDGTVLTDGSTVQPGDDLLLRVAYDGKEDIDGKQVTVTLPGGITAPSVPAGNQAIDSITDNGDGTITIKFKDSIPDDISEGAIGIDLKVGAVEETTDETISWTVDGEETKVTVVVEHKETPPTTVKEGFSKSVNPNNLNGYFDFKVVDGEYVFDGLKDSILDKELTYTLQVNSPEARSGYTIADQLPAGLGYIAGSFSAKLRTYNPQADADYTFAPTVTGNSFSGTVDVPENSSLFITYKVKVTDKTALEALIQQVFDTRGYGSGWAQIPAAQTTNTATFGGTTEKTASVQIGDSVPGVCVNNCSNFKKDGSWTSRNVIADEDGNLTPPQEMVYSLTADLRPWTGASNNLTLKQNVVITDKLIDQAEWKTGDADFISASGITLTSAGACPATDVDFQADANVGKYCISGNTLMVNVGKDNTTNAVIKVKAQLNNVNGLAKDGSTTIDGATSYKWPNTASFRYSDGNPFTEGHDAWVITLPDDRDGGLHDTATFSKTGPSTAVQVSSGEQAEVPYTFSVDTSKDGIDPLKSTIVDYLDTDVFELNDLDGLPVTGKYGDVDLARSDFAVSLDADGNLVIALSDAGKSKVGAATKGQKWTVNVVFTTKPFDGKETFEISNKATLTGEDGKPQYWDDDDSEATSYGNEAEIRKRVYDEATGKWVDTIHAEETDGAFIDDTYVYRVEFIPRGTYGRDFPVKIFTFSDKLPDALDFQGFVQVDADEVPDMSTATDDIQYLNGNIHAQYDSSNRWVTIEQNANTNLDPSKPIAVYFALKANDASNPVVNKIGNTEATIEPYGKPSIDIEKWNDEGSAPEYDKSGALTNDGYDGDFDKAPGKKLHADTDLPIDFTISNDGKEDLKDVKVSDELTDGSGTISGLECTFPDGSKGTEWAGLFKVGVQFECTGTLPGLSPGQTHADTAKVTGIGAYSGKDVDDEDDWNGYVPDGPSIDIEKWNDEGAAPEYDKAGALTNDGYDGDFDAAPGKAMVKDTPLPINFTISNDGQEELVDVKVSDKLTGGKGTIEDLECTFPDGSKGTEWAGPFEVGVQFPCTGTLPGLDPGDTHADLAQVTGVGQYSGKHVDDADEWHARVPDGASIDIEKWNDEGAAPKYDDSGALTNDGFDGDFDKKPGKTLKAGKMLPIRFTVSNDGAEALVKVKVSDELTSGKGKIQSLTCTFPDGSKGTEWDGPFKVGVQFECTGALPALLAGQSHSDTAKVTAEGLYSGQQVGDSDDWHGAVPAVAKEPGLSVTGGQTPVGAIIAGLLLLLVGGGAVAVAARMRSRKG